MSEYTRLKTELKSRKFSKMEIEFEVQRKLKSLKELLAASSIRSLDDIDFDLISDLSHELKEQKDQWLLIVGEIQTIEKELK